MKRILLLDHPQFTSATYFLWKGLKEFEQTCRGALSVSCYPLIPTNYDQDEYDLRSLDWFYELDRQVEGSKRGDTNLPHGIPPFQKTEGLTFGGETLMRRGSPWRKFQKENVPDEAKLSQDLEDGKYDLVILGNSHRVPTILLARLRARVGRVVPTVYYDAGERDELNEHWVHVFRPDLVFKQILTPEVKRRGLSVQIPGYALRIYPLPLSSPLVGCMDAWIEGLSVQWLRENSRSSAKMMPVFYALGNTWPERQEVIKALDALVLRRDISRVKSCSYLNYNIAMAKSRMAVTMRGSGRDTNHYWEIPLYHTAMISDGTMGCIHPYPFEDRKTALFYRSIPELVSIVENYLPDSGPVAEELSRIAAAGQGHLEQYHSTEARAVFFLDILEKELNFFDADLRTAVRAWQNRRGWDRERPWEGPVV